MEEISSTVTYRLKGDNTVRTFETTHPTTAMQNLALNGEVDMMFASGTYRPQQPSDTCCGNRYCVTQRQMNDGMEGW